MEKEIEELVKVAESMRDYIDALPTGLVLPAMPGFDRDWVDEVIAKSKKQKNPRWWA